MSEQAAERAPEGPPEEPSSDELVFGLVAPIGVDLDLVVEVLTETLREVSYQAEADPFRLTKLMAQVALPISTAGPTYIQSVRGRIEYANEVRTRLGDDALAGLAVSAIRDFRTAKNAEIRKIQGQSSIGDDMLVEIPLSRQAYIIRQLKRPEEVGRLRRVYGKRFILISVYAPMEHRRRYISDEERKSRGGLATDNEIECSVNDLIAQDAMESGVDHGQAVRDAFPMGDVFIEGTSRKSCEVMLRRFIHAFFGDNQVSPTRDEYAMYLAKSASLRSADLSRQVGAAIMCPTGEVATLGCNEVPRSGGGTYWADSTGDARDFVLGFDPNERQTREVLVDLIDRLKRHGDLAARFTESQQAVEIVSQLLADRSSDGIAKSRLMDIIEFGRIIHAEMSAITDAARKGVAIKDATLFCTTFPCHLCAKHIVSSGIRWVVFLEPYPKSYAWKLHNDSIEVDGGNDPTKVLFEAFIGIAPTRYRDLFEKRSRKKDGAAQKWNKGSPSPMLDLLYPEYFNVEKYVVATLLPKLDAAARMAGIPSVEPPDGAAVSEKPSADVAPDTG